MHLGATGAAVTPIGWTGTSRRSAGHKKEFRDEGRYRHRQRARTPVGAFNGAFAALPAHELGKVAISEALKRAGVEGGQVSEVILGQILTAGQGQNPARQASIGAGIPVESPAWGVNQLCGSGLRAVALGYQAILNGDSEIVVAGGQEFDEPGAALRASSRGVKMGNFDMVDTMIKDGLWDAFNGYHMGNTAENVARQWQITRAQQDEFAVASQNKAEAAQKAGKFKDEIAPVTVKTRKGDVVVDTDEYPKHGTTLEAIAKLRPAFSKDGTRDRRQCLRHQRRRGRGGADEGERGGKARQDPARAHRVVGACRRRSGDHGHRADPGLARGAQEGRLEDRGPRSRSKPTKPSPRRPARSTRTSAGIPARSTSTAARLRSAIRSAPPAGACW